MLRKCFIVFVCVYSLTGFSKSYYIPHIHTENDSWETYLIVDNNSSDDSAEFTLLLRNGTDIVLNSEYELEARGTQTISLREYSGTIGTVISDSCYIRVRLGYVAKESYGGGTAEFDTDSELNDTAVFSLSAYSDNLTWAGFALCNFVNGDVEVTARIILRNGTSMSVEPFTMTGYEKKVGLFDEEFGISFQDIASVIFYTDKAVLSGILISGNSLEKLLFTQAMPESTNWVQNSVSGGTTSFVEVGGMVLLEDSMLYKISTYHYTSSPNAFIKKQNAITGEFIKGVSPTGELRVRKVIAQNNRIFIAGTKAYGYNDYYFIGELNTDTLEMIWDIQLDRSPFLGRYNSSMLKNKISFALSENNMMVCLSDISGNLVRYLIDINSQTVLESRSNDMTHLLGEVFYNNGYFYYFRSDRSGDDTTAYSKLNLYYCADGSLSGGGRVYSLPDTDPDHFGYLSGCDHSVIQSGHYVEDNILYITLHYSTVPGMLTDNYTGLYWGAVPASVLFAAIDLNTREMTQIINTFVPCQFGARTTILKDSEGDMIAFTANEYNPNQNTSVIPVHFLESEMYYEFIGPVITVNMAVIDPVLTDDGDIIYSGFARYVKPGKSVNSSQTRILFGRKPLNEFLTLGPDTDY